MKVKMVNVTFIKSRCPHCKLVLNPVNKINMNLPINKRINMIDSIYWENFGINVSPIMSKLKFDGYPTLFLSGTKVNHPLTSKQLKNFLDGYFEKDKVLAESPDFMRRRE